MSDDPSPLEPDQLDELLSAALDGDFDAAARDLGLTVDEAHARIRATPGADARRVALASARDLLAVAPPIDELLAGRLRAKAVRAADAAISAHAAERKRRRNRILLGAGGIAAAAAALVAVATSINSFHADTSSKSASSPVVSPRTLAPKPTAPAVTALGSFTDLHALAAAAVQRDAATRALTTETQNKSSTALQPAHDATDGQYAAAPGTSAAATPSVAPNSGDSLKRAAGAGSNSRTTTTGLPDTGARLNLADTPARTCNAPPQVPAGDTPVLRATATLSGKPVVVLVYAGTGEHVVVIEDTNCKLLNLQMFP